MSVFPIGARVGADVSGFVSAMAAGTASLKGFAASAGLATRARHKQSMERGVESLQSALSLMPQGEETADITAEELRTAIRALDSLVGRVDIDAPRERGCRRPGAPGRDPRRGLDAAELGNRRHLDGDLCAVEAQSAGHVGEG